MQLPCYNCLLIFSFFFNLVVKSTKKFHPFHHKAEMGYEKINENEKLACHS